MAQDQRRAWLVVASLFIALLLVLGPTASTLSFYFTAFVKLFGWTHAQVSLIATTFSLAMGLSAPAAGWLLDYIDASLVMSSGAILVVVGLLVASQAHSLSPVLWAYVLIGAGVGSSTMVPASVVATNWFSERRGLALGTTLAGAAAASVTMPLLVNHLLLRYGTRATLEMSVVPIVIVVLPLVLLVVRTRPRGVSARTPGDSERAGVAGLEFGQALRTAPFWLLVAVQVCFGAGFGGVHYHFVPMVLNAGYSQSTAAILMSTASSIAVVSFFLIGIAADRFGGRATLAWTMALLGVGVGAFGAIGYRPMAVPALVLAMVLIGLFAGSAPIASPILLVETLGLKRFGSLWGLLNFCGLIGFAIGPVLVGRAFDRTASYAFAMEICGAVCIIGGLAAAAAFPATGHDLVPEMRPSAMELKPSQARAPL
ncbi:MAG TPA: MFS transporter [Candidatus Binataceae bacterium]|jgi:MFS family permease|nr:MFS transporter [Candidatus Binataceae bacterium]